MQNAEPIVLRQVRDFGQIISTTFFFLKQNWKQLFGAILVVGLPAAIIGGFLAGGSLADLQHIRYSSGDPDDAFSSVAQSLAMIVPGILVLCIGWIFVVAIVHEYMRAYHLGEHHGLTSSDLVKRGASQLGPYFGAGFLSGLLIGVGFLLCLIPGFYVWSVLSLALAAHAIERTGGSGALGRSNQLVQGDFWPTLGLVLVISIINGMINGFVQVPFMIVEIVVGLNTGLDAMDGDSSGLPAWYSLFNSFATAIQWCAQMLTYPIVAVCMVLKYFSRVEEKEGHGLREKIAGFDQA